MKSAPENLEERKFKIPVIQNFQALMSGGLVCPLDKIKIEYSVADEPGLFIECLASAKAVPTWYLCLKKAQGTNTYRKLGTVKEVSQIQAPREALQNPANRWVLRNVVC